jgi:tetratricopeptide (TPR) repeat protein
VFGAPLLFVLAVELGLRLGGYGFPTSFTRKEKVDGAVGIFDNPCFLWKFFDPLVARKPSPFALAAHKPAGAYRIFLLGSSAAMGDPKEAYGMGRVLEVLLRDQYPGVDFEVVNAACAAINSHVVVSIAEACRRLEPDLFLVYMGNNEVVGPYGAGTVFSPLVSSRSLIRAAIALKAFRTWQLVEESVESFSSRNRRPERWRGMEMFLEERVRGTDPRLRRMYDHLERNLSDICRQGAISGAPVIVSTVGVNLKDSPPFGSLHRSDLLEEELRQWEQAYQEGVRFEEEGNRAEAIGRYLRAEGIDPEYADLQFRLGRCHWEQGNFQEARECYLKARDLDALRFRADSRINEIIRRVASDKARDGVFLADAEQEIAASSPYGTPGKELFYEHVHLRPLGNYVVARTFLDRAHPIVPHWVAERRSSRPALSMEECMRRLALTPWDRYMVLEEELETRLRRPPFTQQLYAEKRTAELSAELENLKAQARSEEGIREAREMYATALRDYNFHWSLQDRYALFLRHCLEDLPGAERQLRELALKLDHPYAYVRLAQVLDNQGRQEEAIRVLEQALKIDPLPYSVHNNLAVVLARQKKFGEAIEHYETALAINPWLDEVRQDLIQILMQEGRLQEAEGHCRKALELEPEDAAAHKTLALVLSRQGRYKEAAEQYEKAAAIDPSLDGGHSGLVDALLGEGRLEEAEEFVRAMLKIAPGNALAHSDLGEVLMQRGRDREAMEHCGKALEIDPNLAEAHNNLGNLLASAGRLEEAAEHYAKAAETAPPSTPVQTAAHNNLAQILLQRGEVDRAIAHYQKALEINPDFAVAHYGLGLAFSRQGRTAEAVERYKEAIQIDPQYESAHYNLGCALMRLDEIDGGIEHLRETVRLNPGHADALFGLGLAYERKGAVPQAVEWLGKALAAEPKHARAHLELGVILRKQGQGQQALQHLHQAISCAEESGDLALAAEAREIASQIGKP